MFQAGLERLCAGEPLAYITGLREFWSLPLVVAPAVLVPRPETELAGGALPGALRRRAAPHRGPGHRLGRHRAGRGEGATGVVDHRPDFSADGLQIAQINPPATQLANVELRQGRWCDALGGAPCDAILSNPPYVAAGHPALAALRHEPVEATGAGDEGYADLLPSRPAHARASNQAACCCSNTAPNRPAAGAGNWRCWSYAASPVIRIWPAWTASPRQTGPRLNSL